MRVRTPTSCQDIRQSSIHFGRATFNPHLSSGVSFWRSGEYRFPGASISSHRVVTIRRILRGIIIQRGGAIYHYRGDGLWHRYSLVALIAERQDVES